MSPKKTPSSSLFKKIILAAAAFSLLAVGALAAMLIMTDWNAKIDELTQIASKKLGREIKVGEVEVDIFALGIKLKDVSVANGKGFSKQLLFENKEAQVDLSLMSLFSGQLVLESIRFRQPKILIQKNKAGKFNFSDMIPSQKASPGASGAAQSAQAESTMDLGALPVTIISFVIEDAQFTYQGPDRVSRGFENLNLKLSGFSLEAAGKSLLEVALVAFSEGKEIPIEFKMLFDLDLAGDRLDIKQWNLSLPSLELEGQAGVQKLTQKALLDVQTRITLDLNSFIKDLAPPSALKKYPPGLKTQGTVTTELKFKGPADNPLTGQAVGTIRFDKVGVSYEDYPAMDSLQGEIKITPRRLSSQGLDFNLASSPIKFKMSADYNLANLMGDTDKLKMKISYRLTSPKLILDPLMAFVLAQEQAAAASGSGSAAAAAGGSLSPLVDYRKIVPAGLRIEGKTKVQSFQFKEIKTGALTHSIVMKNRKAKTAFNMNLFEGNIKGKMEANLNVPGIAYSFDMAVKNMQLAPFVNAAVASYPKGDSWSKIVKQYKGKVSGALSARAAGWGKDLRVDPALKNLKMRGKFKLLNAELKQIKMLQKIANVIPQAKARAALGNDIRFEYFGGGFNMSGGKFVWSNVKGGSGKDLRSGDLLVESKGWFYPPEGAINAMLTSHFNPSLIKLKGIAQDALADKKGWIEYDIAYKGASLETAKADYSAGAKRAAKKALKKQVDKQKKILKKQAKKKVQAIIKKQGKDLFKKLPGGLNKLFGK